MMSTLLTSVCMESDVVDVRDSRCTIIGRLGAVGLRMSVVGQWWLCLLSFSSFSFSLIPTHRLQSFQTLQIDYYPCKGVLRERL